MLCTQANFVFLAEDEHKRNQHCENLSANGCDGGARHAKLRKTEQTEDEDRVENDVEHRSNDLHEHHVKVLALRLQNALAIDLHEHTDRAGQNDGKIGDAVFKRLRNRCISPHERARAEDAEQHEHQHRKQHQRKAVARRVFRFVVPLCAKAARNQRIDAYTGADGDGDHEHKDRKRERNRGQRVFTEIGDEDAVYNVVNGLHQHRQRKRRSHAKEQLSLRLYRHFVDPRGGGWDRVFFHNNHFS